MKRFIVFLLLFFCSVAHADTETINWYMDDNVYATTTCESGGDITLPTAPTKYGYTFQGWSSYVPIEYLEGYANVQYINTGIIPNSSMNIYGKFSYEGGSTNASFFGARKQTYDGVYAWTTSEQRIKMQWFTDSRYELNNQRQAGDIYEYDIKNSLVKIIKNNETLVEYQFSPTGTTSEVLFVNAVNNGGGVPDSNKSSKIRVYKFSIEGVIDLIPVLDSNNVPCMYDTIGHNFYYNAGTGDFIAGPVIGE